MRLSLREFVKDNVPGLLFATVSGAHLYGFPSKDSDYDIRGAHAEPIARLVGLDRPHETQEAKISKADTEFELVSHEIGKYLRMLGSKNGYVLEQIFSPLILTGHAFLEILRDLAIRCITRHHWHHYDGFLETKLDELDESEEQSVKNLLYAYRVALTGIHLLGNGVVEANLLTLTNIYGLSNIVAPLIERKIEGERVTLSDPDYTEHRGRLDALREWLSRARRESKLPEEPPRELINNFLVRLRLGRAITNEEAVYSDLRQLFK